MTEGEYVCCNYEQVDATDCKKNNSIEPVGPIRKAPVAHRIMYVKY
jgi:hypothetical protein